MYQRLTNPDYKEEELNCYLIDDETYICGRNVKEIYKRLTELENDKSQFKTKHRIPLYCVGQKVYSVEPKFNKIQIAERYVLAYEVLADNVSTEIRYFLSGFKRYKKKYLIPEQCIFLDLGKAEDFINKIMINMKV